MPVYNAMPYLPEAVGSVLGQTYGDFELIAVDDGSTDASWDYLQQAAAGDDRLRPVRIDHGGIVAALNAGLAAARGQLIGRMDADDRCAPEKFAQQVAYLDAHPETVAVGTDLRRIDPAGRPIGPKGVSTDPAAIEAALLRGRASAMTHATTVWRRSAMDAAGGGYREWARHAEDLELFLRIAEVGRLANLDRVLYEVRKHPASVTHGESERRLFALKSRIVAEARARRGLPMIEGLDGASDREVSTWDHRLLWASRAAGAEHFATARHHAAAVLRRRPWKRRGWAVLVGSSLPRPVFRWVRDRRRRRRAGRGSAEGEAAQLAGGVEVG
jgi:glycosyltransferase involved in cell wall biosynthesis